MSPFNVRLRMMMRLRMHGKKLGGGGGSLRMPAQSSCLPKINKEKRRLGENISNNESKKTSFYTFLTLP